MNRLKYFKIDFMQTHSINQKSQRFIGPCPNEKKPILIKINDWTSACTVFEGLIFTLNGCDPYLWNVIHVQRWCIISCDTSCSHHLLLCTKPSCMRHVILLTFGLFFQLRYTQYECFIGFTWFVDSYKCWLFFRLINDRRELEFFFRLFIWNDHVLWFAHDQPKKKLKPYFMY